MSSITRLEYGDTELNPAKRRFRGRPASGKADPVAVERQARITLLAFQAHADRADALAFLNEHCDALDGRPLEVAGRAEEGFVAAAALLDARRAG